MLTLAEAVELAQANGVASADVDSFLLLAGAAAALRQAGLDTDAIFGVVTDSLGYRTVPLRLWIDPREEGTGEGGTAGLAAIAGLARGRDLSSTPIRLAFVGELGADLVEHLRTSVLDTAVRSCSFARLDGPPVRPLDWPIRVAVAPEFRQPLADHRWAPRLLEHVDALRPGARPHVVAGNASWIRDWASHAPEQASLAVVLGSDPSPSELFDLVGRAAGGWVHFPAATDAMVPTVGSDLIVQLSHNQSVDEAVTWIERNTETGPGTLVASPAWLAVSRLTGTIARAADAQDRLEAIDSTRSTRTTTRRRLRTQQPPSRPDGEQSLALRFRDRHFESETSDASEVAPELRTIRQLTADRDDRYLTADVTPGPVVDAGDAGATTTTVEVWIAPLDAAGSAVAPDRFLDDALPWSGVAMPLDIVLFELRDRGLTARRRIELPPRGTSTRAQFEVPRGAPFDARVVVFHNHRFVQSMLLTVDAAGTRVSLDRECLIRPADADLLDATPYGAALVLNDHDGPLLAVATPEGEEIRAPVGLDDLRQSMTDLLTAAIDDPDAFGSLAEPKYVALLVELAKHGSTLRDVLFTGDATAIAPEIYAALRAAPRISVFSAVPSHVLPLELVYEPRLRIPLGQAGSVCEHARVAFANPESDMAALHAACVHVGDGGTCGGSEAQVCPLGFWGLRKVIERHTNRTKRGRIERDYAVSSSPSGERPTVDITRVMAAATPKADANPVAAWQAAQDAMVAELGTDLSVELSWPSIIDTLTSVHEQLGMMVLVPHVDRDRTGQFLLDLGSEPRLAVHDVALQLELRNDRPVVLLLGCVTGPGVSPTEEFPGRFLDAGASAVLATMTLVRGRFVAGIARATVVALRQDVTEHGVARLGDAVLRVRQRLLGTNPLVLTLVAYGDADWMLTGATTED